MATRKPAAVSGGYTRVPNVIFDQLLTKLSLAELRITLYLARQTFGWRRERFEIGLRRLAENTGLHLETVASAVRSLEECGILTSETGLRGRKSYRIRHDKTAVDCTENPNSQTGPILVPECTENPNSDCTENPYTRHDKTAVDCTENPNRSVRKIRTRNKESLLKEKTSTAATAAAVPISNSKLLENRLLIVAQEIHERHPRHRRCRVRQICASLRAIIRDLGTPGAKLEKINAIDANHASFCMSPDWTKEDGRFAKGLENWLAPTKGRFENDVPAPQKTDRRIKNPKPITDKIWSPEELDALNEAFQSQ